MIMIDYKIKYIFFESIFNFITKGYLDKDSLKKQLDEITNEREPYKDTLQTPVLAQLENFQELTNQEFNIQLTKATKEITHGQVYNATFIDGEIDSIRQVHCIFLHPGIFRTKN